MQQAAFFHDDRKSCFQPYTALQSAKPAAQETAIEILENSKVLMTCYVRKYVPL